MDVGEVIIEYPSLNGNSKFSYVCANHVDYRQPLYCSSARLSDHSTTSSFTRPPYNRAITARPVRAVGGNTRTRRVNRSVKFNLRTNFTKLNASLLLSLSPTIIDEAHVVLPGQLRWRRQRRLEEIADTDQKKKLRMYTAQHRK